MQLQNAIEELHLDNLKRPEIKYQLSDCVSNDAVIELTKKFLTGIGTHHEISGKIIYKMQDMIYQFQLENTISRDQKIYLVSMMLDYWNNLDLATRDLLQL